MNPTSNSLDYEPLKFLRCHSKNNDSADLQTQVWDCAFEPLDGDFESYIVATCGGNSVCFIDCVTGTVISKYYAKESVQLFSLAWTRFHVGNETKQLLVTGGFKGILYFIDFSRNKCILEHQMKSKPNISINALYFHKTDPGILFCGTRKGEVRIGELKKYLNDPKKLEFVVNICISGESEVFDFSFCLSTKLLLSSCNNGIITFYFPSRESFRSSEEKKGTLLVLGRRHNSHLVDSVEVLKDGLIACKYALHSCIYICDLKPLSDVLHKNGDVGTFEFEPLYTLKWSSTDNYFMHMGTNIECTLLCCGDDKGSLWLYNLKQLAKKSHFDKQENIDPSAVIPWPYLTDHYNDKKRKLNLDVYDIVIDKVVIHSSGTFIVAVTNNNLVCLWKKM